MKKHCWRAFIALARACYNEIASLRLGAKLIRLKLRDLSIISHSAQTPSENTSMAATPCMGFDRLHRHGDAEASGVLSSCMDPPFRPGNICLRACLDRRGVSSAYRFVGSITRQQSLLIWSLPMSV